MAYNNPLPTVTRKGREVVVTITETDAEATSEPQAIALEFVRGRVIRQTCVLTSGAGTTVDPILGTATNPSGASVVMENGTAKSTVDTVPDPGTPFYTATGLLYHRSVPDAGTDNSITTTYYITVGW